MRLSEPRVPPIADEDLDEEGREFLRQVSREGRVLNIYRTLAAHPKLLKRWGVFGTHVLYKSTLPARERELLILRTGWLCRSEYEWGQHVIIARACRCHGRRDRAGEDGAGCRGWSRFDAALVRAADELHNDAFISDATWQALSERFDTQQLIDVDIHGRAVPRRVDGAEHARRAAGRRREGVRAMRLEGKVAIVVGAGQTPGETIGNGRATAILFAREGAKVLLVDRDLESARETQAMIEEEGGTAVAFEADAARETDCEAMVEACRIAVRADRYPAQQRGHRRWATRGRRT